MKIKTRLAYPALKGTAGACEDAARRAERSKPLAG